MCSAQKRFRCETVVLRFKLKSAESQLEKVEEANDQKLRTIKSFYRERPPAKFFVAFDAPLAGTVITLTQRNPSIFI